MRRRTIIIGTVAVVGLVGIGAAGAAAAWQGGDDDQSPITGDALTRASAAALAYTGGGRVTETEVGDEESLYEVEVTLDDGSQVDVQLDEHFEVVSSKVDHEDADSGTDSGADQ